jgi:hypothetical protein
MDLGEIGFEGGRWMYLPPLAGCVSNSVEFLSSSAGGWSLGVRMDSGAESWAQHAVYPVEVHRFDIICVYLLTGQHSPCHLRRLY